MNLPRVRTLREAAEESGICYNRLRLMCLQGKLIYVKAGRKFLVNMDSLANYLNTGDPERTGADGPERMGA